ncbi:MAG: 4Fe-4S dicluster domain-containing protein [Deltaproteobacteria bacterium]|nr:4Fe-4S dicluster domain-containing protein [Deltaproteobacteria bacterium]
MSNTLLSEDYVVRMQRELRAAKGKKPDAVQWAMVIDVAKCAGCHACTIGCVAENKLPPGVVYRPVMEEEIGRYPNVRRRFLPRPCMHCMNPPCVKVCPVKATFKNKQGVTVIDYKRCIGCRACLVACPYAARTADFGEFYTDKTPEAADRILGRKEARAGYELTPAKEYGKDWPARGKKSPVGNARKCHFCLHRIAVGQLPVCVTTCIGRATYFGNRNDPNSLIAELLASPRIYTLKPELGTKPSVYYLS